MSVVKKARMTKWVPKRWQPHYDIIVMAAAEGHSNTAIAAATGYDKQQISNILNTPQAELLQQELIKKRREKAFNNVPEILAEIGALAVNRVKQLLSADDLFEKSPFQIVDRSIKLLEGSGHLRHGNTNASNMPPMGNTFNGPTMIGVGDDLLVRLVNGLEKANEVKTLHPDGIKLLKTGTDS